MAIRTPVTTGKTPTPTAVEQEMARIEREKESAVARISCGPVELKDQIPADREALDHVSEGITAEVAAVDVAEVMSRESALRFLAESDIAARQLLGHDLHGVVLRRGDPRLQA